MTARTLHLHTLPRFALECGATLAAVRQAYHLDGALNAACDNVVLVFHALTGSADAAGDWWSDVIGPGRALDTDRYAVLSPNLLGSCYGTTGPSTRPGMAFPPVTTRDQARLAERLVRDLGVPSLALVAGGSLGGMVALEFLSEFPGRARAAVVLAAPASHGAQAIAWNHLQREALVLGGDGDDRGLALARQIGVLSYRTAAEFAARFGRTTAEEGRFAVGRYLDHHGRKLVQRFDARTYRALIDAMDAHDIGRGRGGTDAALAALRAQDVALVAAGIPGDLLYAAEEVRAWAAVAGATYREIRSDRGHDAFLLETGQVSAILREALQPELLAAACGSFSRAAPL
jgi:homoserine O-acetyltransferase/O-succinyltransferase